MRPQPQFFPRTVLMEDSDAAADVATIMEELRRQLWADRAEEPPLVSESISPVLRPHVVRLRETASRFELDPTVQRSSVPLVGPAIAWWRARLHQLVLFYMKRVIRQQTLFNQAVTRAFVALAENQASHNAALREELEALRREIDHLKAALPHR